jgi:hypothetical protein
MVVNGFEVVRLWARRKPPLDTTMVSEQENNTLF